MMTTVLGATCMSADGIDLLGLCLPQGGPTPATLPDAPAAPTKEPRRETLPTRRTAPPPIEKPQPGKCPTTRPEAEPNRTYPTCSV